ncbi:MAG: protein kinase domain-containing protein [Ruminococcus sp.]|jgi:serine/threonine protein kinase/Tfp pilus assembly protein PilF
MLHRGEVLNNTYEVVEEIGQGGAGIVYLAYHLRLQKKVVIKKMKDHSGTRISERREADILKSLHHKYLPQVYDFVQTGDSVYTVMDYIEGWDLLKYIQQGQHFNERQLLIWMRQLAEVLEYLHGQNPPIVHSDIKPSNIMITLEGDVCLIDFNISFGDSGMKGISGYSQRYASPEQIYKSQLIKNGGDPRMVIVDYRTDIYSLGASFYHVITGYPPVMDGMVGKPLLSWSSLPYSRWFLGIIDKAMQTDPARRYQSAAELLGDLLNIRERDSDYKKVKTQEKIIYVFGFLLILAGVICLFMGSRQITRENFQEEYQALEKMAQSDDYDVVVSTGVELLNNKKYAEVLADEQEEKGNILYIIANCYFEQEDYRQAIRFYREALSCNGDNPEYYRDYGIALARHGDVDEASAALESAIEQGLGQSQIYLVQAEIALAEKDYSAAVDDFRQAIEGTENQYDKSRAYLLCARAYRAMGDYAGEIAILQEAEQQADSRYLPSILRALGAASTRYGAQAAENESRASYQEALRCYETLVALPSPSFNDEMNLAVVRQILGDYGGAKDQLLAMAELYPDDYRVYMKLALLECVIQGTLDESSRNYSQADTYYQRAEQYYESVRNSGQSDAEMQDLENTIQELRNKGWL